MVDGMVEQFRANNVEQTLLHGNPSNPTKTQRFYVFKRLWNSVRPGYVVKHLTTNDPDLKANDNINIDMVAFDGANSMVVLFNNYTSTNKYDSEGVGDKVAQVPDDRDGKHDADKGSTKIVSGSQRFRCQQECGAHRHECRW